jgi:5-methyltetrahydrofolate--homocysteine methyltransferase
VVQKALDDGVPAADILDKALIAGMNIIGGKFKNGEVFVPVYATVSATVFTYVNE